MLVHFNSVLLRTAFSPRLAGLDRLCDTDQRTVFRVCFFRVTFSYARPLITEGFRLRLFTFRPLP